MITNPMSKDRPGCPHKSDFAERENSAQNNEFSPRTLAPNGATESARQSATPSGRKAAASDHGELGPPLTIDEVAAMLGCSVWTVRQRYMRDGLPSFRASRMGKLVFFRDQVIHWILNRQRHEKGGIK